MFLALDVRNHVFQNAVFIDDEGRAMDAIKKTSHEFLRSPHIKRLDYRFIDVRNQRIRKAEFLTESQLCLLRVGTDTQHLVSGAFKTAVVIGNITCLHRAGRRIGFWIEEYYEFLSFIIGQ